jgi:hypothetical protein
MNNNYHLNEKRIMTGDQIMDLGRKHGINMLSDLENQGATSGEMLGVASFAFKGIMLAVGIKSGHDMKTIRKTFDECLDAWLEDELKTE